MDKSHRRKARKYLEEFYSTIGRPASVKRLFGEGRCKDVGM